MVGTEVIGDDVGTEVMGDDVGIEVMGDDVGSGVEGDMVGSAVVGGISVVETSARTHTPSVVGILVVTSGS